MRALNLRYKLLLLLVVAVSAAVLSVGFFLSQANREQFEQQADQRFDATRRALIGRLQALEAKAQEQARVLAERPDLVATVNLVYSYQSRQRYLPLVFDGEKKNLARELGNQAAAARNGDRRVITVYDAHDELVSFARADGDSIQFGFLSYENGKPVAYTARPETAEWSRLGTPPETCAEDDPATASASGYGQCAGRFMLRAVAPVIRVFPSGASLQVGRVVLSEQIGSELAAEISEETGARLALYLHNRPLGGTLDEVKFDERYGRAALPLLRDTDQRQRLDAGRYLIQPYSIALGGAVNAYVLVGVDQSVLNSQQENIRAVVQWALLMALALSLLAAFLFGWLFGRPAARQARHLAALRDGKSEERLPTTDDGFGQLAREAQDQAFALREHRAVLDNLERTRDEGARLHEALDGATEIVELLVQQNTRSVPELKNHAARVAALAVAVAEELELPAEEVQGIRIGALVHDIGNGALPADLLAGSEPLTATQKALVRSHAKAGYDLLKDLHTPWPVALMTLQHHERLDGSGYPMGLQGEDILLPARIIAVADVAVAMLSARPHRAALSLDDVLAEIEYARGTRYDPQVVDACARLLRSGLSV